MPTTTPHASFAGITLPLAPAFLESLWMRVVHDERRFRTWDGWNFDAGTSHLPTPSLPQEPDFRLSVLSWPAGAVRPAFYHCLVETNRLDAIKAAVGTTSVPASLLLADSRAGATVTASMYALPERALNSLGRAFNDLWLLTLTDRRWYDAWRRGFVTQPLSYTHLYAQIATIFDATLAPDDVSSAYGVPSSKWVTNPNVNLLVVLDAAAAACGQRVVYNLDGTIKTVNWETARAASDAYVSARPRVVSGGLTPEASIARYVPQSVNVLFVDTSNPTVVSATPFEVTTDLVDLAIPEYGDAAGVPGTSQTLNADIAYDADNDTEVAAYATQAATDWYGWRLPDLDLVYGGVEPWAPTGWEDCTEWTLKLVGENPALAPAGGGDPPPGYAPLSHTHVFRGPWSDFQSGDYGAGRTPGTTLAVVNKWCPVYETIEYLDWDAAPQSKRVITDFVVERTLVTVAQAVPAGCTTFGELDCCGSGSGGGDPTDCSDCATDCPQCPSVSRSWTVSVAGYDDAEVCHVRVPTDGNYCRWISEGGAWELSFVASENVWVVVNYDTGDVWFCSSSAFDCTAPNVFASDPDNRSGADLDLAPGESCSAYTYDCTSGGCVAVAGTGGAYPTLAACQAGCGTPPVQTTCCAAPIPATLYAAFGGSLASLGTVTLVHTGGATWTGVKSACGGTVTVSFACLFADFSINLSGAASGTSSAAATTCSPLAWASGNFLVSLGCAGTGSVSVTE